MARTNKYTSVNFNDIYEKKFSNPSPLARPTTPSPNGTKSKPIISNSRIHGNMLVLTRPTPKPIEPPLDLKAQQAPPPKPKDQQQGGEPISLRPQGRTGSAPSLSAPVSPLISPSGSAAAGLKTNKFVPPHLRPGFVGREEKPVGPRPKSGGGYEGAPGINNAYPMNRYASRGTRPNSSG